MKLSVEQRKQVIVAANAVCKSHWEAGYRLSNEKPPKSFTFSQAVSYFVDDCDNEEVPFDHASLESLAGCCGIAEVRDFRGTNKAKYTPREIGAFVAAMSVISEGYAGAIATTIPEQMAAISLLRYTGFTPIKFGPNPSSKNPITLWYLKG